MTDEAKTNEAKIRSVLHSLARHALPPAARAAPIRAPRALRRAAAPQAFALAPAPDLALPPDWAVDPGVKAFGLGEKETCGRLGSEVVLKVYVERKLPSSTVEKPVPKAIAVDGADPVPTDVVEIGRIALHSNTQRIRPAIPGFSVSRAGDSPNTATFGMVVRKKGQAGPFYLLSNCHAIAASGLGSKGDVIIQPGAADQGNPDTDRIGILADWAPFDFSPTGRNTIDAAIAQLDDNAASAAIALLGVPTGVNTQLTRGTYVQKVGRTTNQSVARVTDVDLVLPVTYPTASGYQRTMMYDQVLATFYSNPGDSGSGVLDMDGKVVGLHVGGSEVVGFFCKIANVLDWFGLEVVTQDNLNAPVAAT